MTRATARVGVVFLALGVLTMAAAASAQTPTGTLRVDVTTAAGPLAGAVVRASGQTAATAADGSAVLVLRPGTHRVVIAADGLVAQSRNVAICENETTTIRVVLVPDVDVSEDITVSATRSGKRMQDEPLRVEALDRDEIEEKLLMTPGDIAMMLNETAGLRVQVTSPSLGAASLRVQGMRGRYTQILSDGLPLYGGQSGSIGLLQIPPMDLGRVEVIKGTASSLFGSSALGGVINLISREPKASREREALVNQTTLGGTDGVLWLSGPIAGAWGYTFLGNVDRQSRGDVDDDGWADVAGYSRVNLRPRVFWNNHAGRSLFATAGVMAERRRGGTLDGRAAPDGQPFEEALDSRRIDAGLVGRFVVGGSRVLAVRASSTSQRHAHVFGDAREDDRHATAFGEVSLTGAAGKHTWVGGAALQSDAYRAEQLPRFDYTFWTPSLFGQDDYTFSPKAALSVSARLDHHNVFGTFLSPRASLLLRPAAGWSMRLSGGSGYFAPTPLTDETDAAGLTRLASAAPSQAERAQTYSADLTRTAGRVELNATLFGSRLQHAIVSRRFDASHYELVSLPASVRTIGAEALASVRLGSVSVVGTYTFVHATEPDADTGARAASPLTPRHAIGLVGMWEREGMARAGVEAYFTGRQRLDDNPYRATSRPYLYLGAMAERRVGGRVRLFVNAENLLDRRQTRVDPLVRPARNFDGRWTVDAWAPLDGRVLNAGLRVTF